jgi:hypothetical protein
MASNFIDARLHAQIASGIDPENQTQGERWVEESLPIVVMLEVMVDD